MSEKSYTKACLETELEEGKAKAFSLGGRSLALCKIKNEIFAIENNCPHQGEPLSGGCIEDYMITCPAHNWKFDIRSGDSPVVPDAFVYTFKTKVEDGVVYILV